MMEEEEFKSLIVVIGMDGEDIEVTEDLAEFSWRRYQSFFVSLKDKVKTLKRLELCDEFIAKCEQDVYKYRNDCAIKGIEYTPDQAKLVIITMSLATLELESELEENEK